MNQEEEASRISRREFLVNVALSVTGGVSVANALTAGWKGLEKFGLDTGIDDRESQIESLTSTYEPAIPSHYQPFQPPRIYPVVKRTPTPEDFDRAGEIGKEKETLMEKSSVANYQANVALRRSIGWLVISGIIAFTKWV